MNGCCMLDWNRSAVQVTRERIRQIEGKALRKLRQPDRQSTLAEYSESADLVTVGGSKGRIKV